MLVPAGTPKGIVDRLAEELMKAMRAPDMKERYATLGLEAVESSPEQFGAFISSEIAKWGDILRHEARMTGRPGIRDQNVAPDAR